MEQAIKKAISGGYKDVASNYKHYGDGVIYTLDPLFWQALGKAKGWTFDGGSSRFSQMTFEEFEKRHWRTHWHNFIDHLIEGKDAESFFNELLK